MKKLILILILGLCALPVLAQESYDLGTALMKATFMISGPSSVSVEKKTLGTCFIIGRPAPFPPQDPNRFLYVLVTADHVLKDMSGEIAQLSLRKKVDENYIKMIWPIHIREKKKPLWIKHPNADVAVMYVALPKEAEVVLLPINMLATDAELKKYEIRPADRLLTLGFPLGMEANYAGFPIMRSGVIASYPILPTKTTKAMLFDFEIFPGNSGGPVFMIEKDRSYGGNVHLGSTTQFIVGLVSQESKKSFMHETYNEKTLESHPLKLGIIVHAALIKETIEMLPEPKTTQQKDSGGRQ